MSTPLESVMTSHPKGQAEGRTSDPKDLALEKPSTQTGRVEEMGVKSTPTLWVCHPCSPLESHMDHLGNLTVAGHLKGQGQIGENLTDQQLSTIQVSSWAPRDSERRGKQRPN